MRKFSMWTLLLALFAAIGLPAEPLSQVMYDNPHVRVLTTTLEPGHKVSLASHSRHRVLVFLDSGRMTRTAADGKSEKLEFKSGEVRWIPASGPGVTENVGDGPLQVVEIELKGKAQMPVVIPDLDPLQADPKHYSLELENDHVRVLRVRFGPLENGVVHTHVRNYVVVYMTHQAKGERGEVRLHLDEGRTTHTENNPLNQAVERIAVELK
jgi:mannose-6-phosphate isomerase-like protein (cupin superfamily)